MSITRTIITTVVALALVAVVAPMVSAQTMTVAQLMAEIQTLQAQLQQLSGTTTTTTGNTTTSGSPAACAGITFTRNLVVGSTGSDVKCLQAILNLNASTQVSTTGAGSPGYETMTFGPKTLVAVKVWQAAQGFTPANQIGPMSRAKLNAWLGGTTTTTTTTTTTNNTTPVVVPTGTIAAMLATTSPASGALIAGQATAGLLDINFTGTGTVSSVTLQRSGISDQNTLANLYLFDGAQRLTDGYSFNVAGQIVINGLSITVNGSHTISVRADVASNSVVGSSGSNPASSIAVALTNYTGNSTVTTANVQGYTQNIVSGSAATAVLGADTVYNSNAQTNINAGTTQYTFWSAPLQVNTRAVMLKAANFKMVGSAPANALSNINMFIDGVSTGTTATVQSINGSSYAAFDLTSAPITLTTGTHTIDVRADIQAGTYRSIQVSLQNAADLTITDPQVGVNIAAVGPNTNSTTFATNTGVNVMISAGSTTVVVDPTFLSQTNISGGSTNAVIGRFTVHAYGENVKVTDLFVTPSILSATSTGGTCITNGDGTWNFGTCGMNNVTVYFNGSQVGSQKNWTLTTSGDNAPLDFSLGSQMIAPAGQDSTIEIRADLQTANSVNYTGGNVKVALVGETTNAQGQSSQQTVGVPQTTSVSTNGLTIQTGALVASANTALLAQAISPNSTGVRLGSYVIQNQSTSEAVRLTSFKVLTWEDSGNPPTGVTDINNLSALRTSDTTGSGSTPIQPTGADTFSVNDTLAPGASMTLDVFANTGANAGDHVSTQLQVVSIGAVDNISTTYPTSSTYVTGQIMALGTGTMATPTLVISSTTPIQYVASSGTGATNASQASYNLVATGGSASVSEMKFTVSGPTTATNVCVGSVCASPVTVGGVATADLTGLALAVPNGGGGYTVNAQVSYPPVGTGGLTPSTASTLSLAYVKYTAGGTTKTIGTSTTCTATLGTTCTTTISAIPANTVTLVGSAPIVTIAQTTPASGFVAAAENQIGQVTVTANSMGAIKVNQIAFTVGVSGYTSGPVWSGPRLANGSTTIPGITCSVTSQGVGVATSTITCVSTTNTYAGDFLIGAGQSQTFNLYATAGGSLTLPSGATGGVSTSITTGGFKWDDASQNGTAGVGQDTGLTGSLIYGFPTNSYSIHQ